MFFFFVFFYPVVSCSGQERSSFDMTPIPPPPRRNDYRGTPGWNIPPTPQPTPEEFRLDDVKNLPRPKALWDFRRFPKPAEIKMSAPPPLPPTPPPPPREDPPAATVEAEEVPSQPMVPEPPPPDEDGLFGAPSRKANREPVALVGPGKIVVDDVFELWNDAWRNTHADVRNGRITAEEGDKRLQEEWKKAVDAAIRDEFLYQQALRDYNKVFTDIVDQLSVDSTKPRHQVASETLRRLKEEQDKMLNQIRAKEIKKNGGAVRIQMHLEALGVSPEQWLKRMERKAYAHTFLIQLLKIQERESSPGEVRDYYHRHAEEFMHPGPVRFRHIFFADFLRGEEAKTDAIEIWEHLADGNVPFGEAANEYSDDRVSAERAGEETGEDSGIPEREAWIRDLREAARHERPGKLAPILQSPFGFHIIGLQKIGPQELRPLMEAYRDIEQKLLDNRWEQAIEKHYATTKNTIPIRILMKHFPKETSCTPLSRSSARAPKIINLTTPQIEIHKISRKR